MRHETEDDGSQMFNKKDYLTAQQITSFWSRHAASARASAVDARDKTSGPSEAGPAVEETILAVPLDEYKKDPNIPTEEMELRDTINFDELCE